MRNTSLLAMVAAIALTVGLVVALRAPDQSPVTAADQPPRQSVAVIENEIAPTSTTVVVLNAWVGLDPEEEHFLAEALEESTTTSTTLTPTTTAPPPKQAATPTNKPARAPTTTTTTTPAPTTTAPKPVGGFDAGAESDFHGRINSYRSGQGLAGLTRNGSLDSMAQSWAKHMGTTGNLSHSSNPSKLIGQWSAAGETVGRGGSVGSLFEAFKASGGHRAIILGDFTHIGIGVWVDGNGVVWTAQLFAKS
jgi:uncharacterized protein YkwD